MTWLPCRDGFECARVAVPLDHDEPDGDRRDELLEAAGVFFGEGDFVKKGKKLFTIDPRPYEAAVTLAEANKA